MAIKSWFAGWLLPRHSKQAKRKPTFRPAFEMLEDRLALAVFSVSNNGDSGTGSLRQAIINANANAGHDTIRFSTSSVSLLNGYHINLQSSLPQISSPLTIDGSEIRFLGTTFSFNRPMVELIGTNAGNGTEGIHLNTGAAGSTIRGLVINRFDDDGIAISGSNMVIQNCWIGLTFDGNGDAGNDAAGVRLIGSASNNLIGGPSTAQRNIISGQAVGIATGGGAGAKVNNTIQGNFIGTNVAGTADLGNNFGVFFSNPSSSTLISGNVISGNNTAGITLAGATVSDIRIESNLIGLAANAVDPLGNGKFGVFICNGSHDNNIGGIGVSNTFAFNGQVSVLIGSDPTNITLDDPAGVGNTVLNNIFFSENFFLDLGPNDRSTPNDPLDADTGPNNLQNSVVLTAAVPSAGNTIIQGTLNSTPNSSFTIQLFASTLLDANLKPLNLFIIGTQTLSTNAAGNLTFNITVPAQAAGTTILANATNALTGDTSELNNQVTVPNNPPMIRDDVLTPEINEGEYATLSGRLVDPDPGDKLSLVVNWGDGSPIKTYHPGLDPFAFKHRYTDDGVYNVTFTWLDNHGGSNTRTRQVVVHEVAPVLSELLLVPDDPLVNERVTLTGRITSADPGPTTLTVDWGDGTVETIRRGGEGRFRLTHRYASAGVFTIQLTVADDDDGSSSATLGTTVV